MNGRMVVIDLTPPCATCLHEAVCSIRRAIEAMPPLEVPMPDAAFALDVSTTIVCSEYLPEKPVKIRRPMSEAGKARIRAGIAARKAAGE